MIRRAAEISWREADRLDRQHTLCILPVSSLEQHGHHLPLGTDDLILDGALGALEGVWGEEDGELLIFPSLKYGNSVEHTGFCGTISLRVDTLQRVIRDVAASLADSGFRHLLLLNSHGGNTAILQGISQELYRDLGIRIWNVDLWASRFFSFAEPLIEAPLSGECHGGEIETSLLMYWTPELVADPGGLTPEELNCTADFGAGNKGWLTREISETGIIGDARASRAETGEKLAAGMGEQLGRILREIYGGIR